MKIKLVLTVCLIGFSMCPAVAINCPALPIRSGFAIQCHHTSANQTVDCYNDVPVSTLASYSCQRFYTSPFGDRNGGIMDCQEDGTWSEYPSFDDFTCYLDCGHPTVSVMASSPVVVFGETATRESFPWHATIFIQDYDKKSFRYYCGGSLISPWNKGFLILTAAHCLTDGVQTKTLRPVEHFRVVLGAVSTEFLVNQKANGSQIFTVQAATIHEDYNFNTIQNDIGLIQLAEEVKLEEEVLPICFPTKPMANMQVQGTGLIAGFGVDESTRLSGKFNLARLPVTSTEVCNFSLGKEMTSIEFCAGYKTGSSICSGDSGGGLVFLDNSSKRLFVQGIASNVDQRALKKYKYCQNYNTFTRVSSFVSWTEDQIEEFFFKPQGVTTLGQDKIKTTSSMWNPPVANEYFTITTYNDLNDKGNYRQWKMLNCSAVPNKWNGRLFWINVHGKCVQFFEGRFCSGRSLQLQPTASSSLFKWNFPDFYAQSVSLCHNVAIPIYVNGSSGSSTIPAGSIIYIGKEYETAGLLFHNKYRAKHGVPDLRLNENLNIKAKVRADYLIRQNTLQTSGEGGENLFEIIGTTEDSVAIVKQAVDLWYNSIVKYNWKKPSATSFSQVVWKSSTDLGVGIAKSGRRAVVVAKYSPAGNIYLAGGGDASKYFKENVFPPKY